jgi:hypothetical protein
LVQCRRAKTDAPTHRPHTTTHTSLVPQQARPGQLKGCNGARWNRRRWRALYCMILPVRNKSAIGRRSNSGFARQVTVLACASASPSPSPSPELWRCGQRSNTHRPLRDGLLGGMYQGCAEARPWNVWSAFVMLAVWQQDGANDRGRKWRRGNRALHAKGLACCARASLSSLRTLLPGTPSTHSCCAALPSALILPHSSSPKCLTTAKYCKSSLS